jgi:hypothetical protein
MAKVISSYTAAGTAKGNKARKSEKQASAALRGKRTNPRPSKYEVVGAMGGLQNKRKK